jgi:hypothetical protein
VGKGQMLVLEESKESHHPGTVGAILSHKESS